ncbi:MAG: DUF1476 domain-containing protein [Pseudomonadota bacterium]
MLVAIGQSDGNTLAVDAANTAYAGEFHGVGADRSWDLAVHHTCRYTIWASYGMSGPASIRPVPEAVENEMATFDDRERAFENKFAHDQELKFKAEARRNKMLADWAGEKLGLTGDAAAEYAKDVRRADLEEAGDDDVFRKVRADFDAKGVNVTDDELRDKMDSFLRAAVEQIESKG